MSGKIILTEEMVKEISESLQAGINCYLHKKTGKIIEHMEGADIDPACDEEGSFTQDIQDLEDSPDDYVMFSPMSSSQAFNIMEDFANSVEIGTLKVELLNALNQKHPFQNFKRLVEVRTPDRTGLTSGMLPMPIMSGRNLSGRWNPNNIYGFFYLLKISMC